MDIFIRPVFSGNVIPVINELDFKYANFVLDRRVNKGIQLSDEFDKNEVALLEEYEKLRIEIQEGPILKGYWKVIDGLTGSAPGSQEGSAM